MKTRRLKIGSRGDRRFRAAFGTRLRALRKQHQFSQERLGDKCGLSGKFIGEVERGEKSISLDSAGMVANVFGMPVAQLIGDGEVATPQVQKLIALVEKRPAPVVDRLVKIVQEAVSIKSLKAVS